MTEDSLLESVNSGVKFDKIRAVLPEVLKKGVPEAVVKALAASEDLDTLLWWCDSELKSPHVDKAIHAKLSAGEIPTLSYGKLVERIVTLSKYGEPRFLQDLVNAAGIRQADISLPLRTPVLVAGDMSASMQVCVMSASIIASIICGLSEAELVFFNTHPVQPPVQPKDCPTALEVSKTVRAQGGTANAAALVAAWELKKVYNTVVMVTDEEENQSVRLSTGEIMRFAELFRKYRAEVAPNCELVMVSFLRNMAAETQMMACLRQAGVPGSVISQFKFSQSKPDLTKIDAMLGLMSSGTQQFTQEVAMTAAAMREHGVTGWLSNRNLLIEEQLKQHAELAKAQKVKDLMAQLKGLVSMEELQQLIHNDDNTISQ